MVERENSGVQERSSLRKTPAIERAQFLSKKELIKGSTHIIPQDQASPRECWAQLKEESSVLSPQVSSRKVRIKFFSSKGKKTPVGASKRSQRTKLPPLMAKGHKICIERYMRGSLSCAHTKEETLLNFHKARKRNRKVYTRVKPKAKVRRLNVPLFSNLRRTTSKIKSLE